MANEFKANVGAPVPKSEALKWIEKFDKDVRKDKEKDTKSLFFGRDILQRILDQPGCSGITFFLASKHSDFAKKDTTNLVLVGTREDGTLIWPEDLAGKDGADDGIIADVASTCPPYCPKLG
jgi:hypothetical protein